MKKTPKVQKPTTASRRTSLSRASTSSTENSWKWIRIKQPFPLPPFVKEAIQRLDDAGHVAYVVGGSVRDFLLKREIKDHDIATSASPDELCQLFPNAVTVGKAFGVIKVPLAQGHEMLEIATFREDLAYKDHRHPEGVRFAGPIEDACRRDFTINALFYDPKTSRLLDPTGGMDDLRAGVVRAIGDPRERFREDALRLLRAARFTTMLGFSLETGTMNAIIAKAKLISHISGERIRDELTLMLAGARPADALELLSRLGLLRLVLPEAEAMKGVSQSPTYQPPPSGSPNPDVWGTTLRTIRYLAQRNPKRTPTLAWASLLYDVGKPVAIIKNKGENFNGHEIDGGVIVKSIGHRLKMSRADVERIAALVEDLPKFRDVFKMREATLERFVRLPYFEELLELHRAQALSSDGNLAYYEFCKHRLEEIRKADELVPSKLIDGKDLIQLGFKPGPEFSEILHVVEDLTLERKLTTKEQALEYVIGRFVK